ncbi:putative transcription factor interactor and regulator Znf-B family [Helianthus annuus]|nr:putative transcription factor interactor and regulator Znf-B family [Helianthus annuus]
MKIQCDVCEKSPATLICCADEAALCARCDVEVHAANKLASKHQRLLLNNTLSDKLPPCDICQEKTAFIFCVEDRALFCRDCDEPIHSAGTLAEVKIAAVPEIVPVKTPVQQVGGYGSPAWGVDDLLQFDDFEPSDKKEQLEFGDIEWLTDYDVFGDTAAEVPQLPASQPINTGSFRQTKLYGSNNKRPRYDLPYIEDDDEHNFMVPDLG